ncbi:HD domain-containing protein [Halalkalibacter kiskunsagensis]|uniref:HD domain-containing protein n=1 Tax=Halalkalibacter kiskunsagensis TaxID=1548599 RepID=A0ABV6KHM0_9BACI
MSNISLEEVKIIKKIKEKNEGIYHSFMTVYNLVEPLLNTRISQVFPFYTMHDVNHSLRIMRYMGELLPDLEELNEFELLLLAYSALLHDIGMAASEEEVNQIKKGVLEYNDFKYESILKKFNGNHIHAIQDYVRRVHGIRSADYVRNSLKDYLRLPDLTSISFEDQVSLICQSHTEDINWIKGKLKKDGRKGQYTFNAQFCAIILRLADILDFDSQRTPPILLQSVSPEGISKEEWIQHFSIENSDKVQKNDRGFRLIELHGRCDNPNIHRKILSYIDWINIELNNANDLTQDFQDKYRLLLLPKVYNFIESEGYTIADMKFKVNYNSSPSY